jgi:hypothetical protein
MNTHPMPRDHPSDPTPSKAEQLQAIDTEIARTTNFIRYIESRLPPEQLEAARRADAKAARPK